MKTKVKKHVRKIGEWVDVAREQVWWGGKGTDPTEMVLHKHYKGKSPWFKDGWEYVTHEYNMERQSYYWGHYFTNLADAKKDFEDRISEYRRLYRAAGRVE